MLDFCLLAYGVSGSGKTYTLDSMIKQSLQYLQRKQISIQFSWLQIWGDTANNHEILEDMLGKSCDLKIFTANSVEIRGMKKLPIQKDTDVDKILESGKNNRKVNSHNLNELSSRSHAITILEIEHEFRISRFFIVDLAGSENVKRTNASDKCLREAGFICRSLFQFKKLVREVGRNIGLPCYNDSKLNKLLSDCIGGNAKFSVILCADKAKKNSSETKHTLRFANDLKKVKNKVTKNKKARKSHIARLQMKEIEQDYENKLSESEEKVLKLKRNLKEQKRLRKELEKAIDDRDKELESKQDDIFLAQQAHLKKMKFLGNALQKKCEEIKRLKENVDNQKLEIAVLRNEMKRIQSDMKEKEVKMRECHQADLKEAYKEIHSLKLQISSGTDGESQSKLQEARDEIRLLKRKIQKARTKRSLNIAELKTIRTFQEVKRENQQLKSDNKYLQKRLSEVMIEQEKTHRLKVRELLSRHR